MSTATEFEARLRRQLDEATDGVRAPAGFWDDVEQRGVRRVRRRRIATGLGAAVALAAVLGVAGLLTSPPVPTVEPGAPGDAMIDNGEAEAEAETRRRLEAERDAVARRLRERRLPADPLPPITGYGDFSGVDHFELDLYQAARLEVECLLDAGFDVELIPPGDGIAFNDRDPERNGLAQATADACRAGLNLPAYAPATRQQRTLVYQYQLALRECIAAEGVDVPPAVSLDHYLAEEGWSVYDGLTRYDGPLADAAAFEAMQMRCPQQPVGGFGAWEPGDPVRPVEDGPEFDR